jgi:hypothetical protein
VGLVASICSKRTGGRTTARIKQARGHNNNAAQLAQIKSTRDVSIAVRTS